FSSRRRHTRFSRDWSSDVCSSDLPFRETTLQFFHRRRQQEHEDAVRIRTSDLPCPLDVQIGDDALAPCEALLDETARRAVAVTTKLGPLEEFVLLDHPVERRIIDKKVVDPLGFALSWGTRGDRDRVAKVGDTR